MKNLGQKFKGRHEQAGQRISKDLRFPRKTLEKNKQPEAHCQTDQCTFCGSPKKKGAERTFEEIMVENFPKLIKDMNINIQGAHCTPRRIKSKRHRTRHIIINLPEDKGQKS